MDELLEQLERRLAQLKCLAQPTKAFILAYARQRISETQLREYLDAPLAFVEANIGVVDHADFRELCHRLGELRSLQEVLAALEITDDIDSAVWLRSAHHCFEKNKLRSLYCLANHFAQPLEGNGKQDDLLDSSAIGMELLARALTLIGRPDKAAALLKSYLEKAALTNPQDLVQQLQMQNPNTVANLMQALAAALFLSGRQAEAAATLENYLEHSLQMLNLETKVRLLISLAHILPFLGKWAASATLVDCLFDDQGWLSPEITRTIDPNTRAWIFTHWLVLFGRRRGCKESLNMCRRILLFFRQVIHDPNLDPEDRRLLIERITTLRHLIVQTGYHWAVLESDPNCAEELRLEILCWDCELSQRLLLECYLFVRAFRTGKDGANTIDSDFKPDIPAFASPLPVNGDAPLADDARLLSCFGVKKTQLVPLSPGPRLPAPAEHISWFHSVDRYLREGIEARHLAISLGPWELLLVFAFTRDGSLLWTAYRRSNQYALKVVKTNTRPGQRGDQDYLRWLNDWHDFLLDLTWAWVERRDCPAACQDAILCIEHIHTALKEQSTADLPGLLDDLWKLLRGLLAPSQVADLEAQMRHLLTSPEDCTTRQATTAQWQHVDGLLRQHTDQQIEHFLDAQTKAFHEAVNNIVDLDGLDPLLNPERTDLIVQATGVLHGVSMAYLCVAGHPLFKKVRSIRMAMSLLLTVLQRQAEAEATVFRRKSNSEKLLTASWFRLDRPDAPERSASCKLHLDMQQLAEDYEMSWFSVAEHPEATPANLIRLLAHHDPFRVAVFCGHGSSAGIVLRADSPRDPPIEVSWRGEGADLSGIEFLLFVSCLLGRLRQEFLSDVDGFCIDMVLNQARSVLAARWPIHCWQAPDFALAVRGC